MSLPALPKYSLADAINALGTFQPLFTGSPPPLGTMLHAADILLAYVNTNFITDPQGSAQLATQLKTAGSYRLSSAPTVTLAAIVAAQANPAAVTAFNWMQLIIDIIQAILKAIGGLSPTPATP